MSLSQRLSETAISDIARKLASFLEGSGSLPVTREDLVAEVMLRLLAISDSREIQNPYAYARTILKNLIRDHLRRAERAQRAMAVVIRSQPSIPSTPDESAQIDARELVNYLLQHTDLSELQAKVVRMVYLRDMKLTEVARELSRNPGTILRHLNRALAKLETSAAELELQS